MSNSDIFNAFEVFLLTEKRVAHNTFVAYKKDLEQLADYCAKEALVLSTLQGSHLKQFLATLKNNDISASSASRKISTFKTFFRFAADRFGIPNVSKELVFPKKEHKLPHYLTEQEIELLLQRAAADTSLLGMRNKTMLYLMYATGMRVSELVELKTSDVYMDTGMLMVTGKGGKQRIIPVALTVLRLVADYIKTARTALLKNAESPYLFAAVYAKKAKHLSRQSCWMIVKAIWKKTGNRKNISPHQLRHSLATHLLKNGADLRSLQLWLGHEHLVTVQTYTHVEKTHLRSVYDKKHPRSA